MDQMEVKQDKPAGNENPPKGVSQPLGKGFEQRDIDSSGNQEEVPKDKA